MNNRHSDYDKRRLALGLLALTAVSGGIAYQSMTHSVPKEVPVLYEFVCYTDDKLSEQHVGVVSAIYIRSGDTKIHYKEGGSAVYRQVPGEACALEKVNP